LRKTNKLRRTIQNKRHRMLTSNVFAVLLHDNERPHTAVCSRSLLEYFNWELFDHPPYSPDLTPSGYHLFTYLKNWLGSQLINNNELMEDVITWLSSQAPDFFDTGIQKFMPHTSASIQAVTAFRSNVNMYVYFVYNIVFLSHCLFC
jgi:hypothetical protein